MRTFLIVLLAVIVLGVLAFFGYRVYKNAYSTQAPVTAPTPQAPSTLPTASAAVSLENFSFKPSDMTVSVGTEVTWTNNDSVAHTITVDDNSFGSGDLSKGDTFKHTFESAGTFNYHCSIHTSMKGKITVK